MSVILICKRVMIVVAIKTLQALSDLYNKIKFMAAKKKAAKKVAKKKVAKKKVAAKKKTAKRA